ncbi:MULTISPECIES: hypothetical protein [Ramlibacter]|uniref:DUF11 domain-containing protein n=1 Tax=Ramlibacter pinisoli TaxID=2682844 RepID=A0A6N8ITQ9_9BURK|nr:MULTISPECIES: hypothetical protein [Ramlibacter]MBA2965357.1 hypothetical protein [Ramlibacter sp. CGMCC 1.13660]MVQ30321.1 hypothetical protein [Ramlibacter pinisoli]
MTVRTSLARLGATALLALGALAGTAQAASTLTPAGTPIDNAAKLDYSVGGIGQDQICSSPSGNSTKTCTFTSFKVDNKINLNVTTTDTTPGVSAIPGSTSTLTFVLTNEGNETQDFALSTTSNLSGPVGYMFNGTSATTVADAFDPTNCKIYDNAAPTTEITSIAGLTAGTSVTLKVACSIPPGQVNDEIGAVTLVATAREVGKPLVALIESTTNSPTVVDIVFADGSGTSEDGPRDAKHSARSAFKVSTAAIRVTKTAETICDPVGGDKSGTPPYAPKSIPGSYIQYTVLIERVDTNTSRSATLTNLKDTLATANVTFDSDFITGANVAGSPACAAVGAAVNPGAATSTGKSFKVIWSGAARASFGGMTGTQYLTASGNYTAPDINVNWNSVLPVEPGYAAGELKPGDKLQLIYNVFIK